MNSILNRLKEEVKYRTTPESVLAAKTNQRSTLTEAKQHLRYVEEQRKLGKLEAPNPDRMIIGTAYCLTFFNGSRFNFTFLGIEGNHFVVQSLKYPDQITVQCREDFTDADCLEALEPEN